MREILALLPRPSRYLGIEEGAVQADPATARLHYAQAFPDLYEVGMSYLGQKIIYGQLNSLEGVVAERVFAPCRDAARILREHAVPLATLESDTPLGQTHMIGFSLTHELAFTNILYMLDLAGIPLRTEKRGDDLHAWPLVVVGGGCTLCAEPLAPFVDMMLLGESEAMLSQVALLLIQAREDGWTKSRFLEESRHIPGVYVPSLFTMANGGSLTPVFADYTQARRRPVADMKEALYPVQQVVPLGAVHNRLSLEIARGCTRGCRFCQAGMTLRPSRERSIEEITSLMEECLTQTGYDDVSFLSLSTGDFSGLKTLFFQATDRCVQEQISLSLPSLRVGSVDSDIMKTVAGIRRTGATLAPEAGSQRLRDVINKGVTEEGLLRHVRHLISHGWQQVKLYFMIGLPTETYEDLDELVQLCLKVRDVCRYKGEDGKWQGPRLAVTASVSPFVPKTHTPFQWDEQISLEEMKARIYYLRNAIKPHKNLTLRWHEPAMSHLEGILSRGDRRLAEVVEKAYHKGAIFSSWVEGFDLQPWLEALAECNMTPEPWIGARALDAPLPWDHLEAGISKEFLLKERERAFRGAITEDCRYGACRQCGACDTKAGPSLLRALDTDPLFKTMLNFPQRDQRTDEPDPPAPKPETGRKKTPPSLDPRLTARAVRFRVWHTKEDRAAWISQLELQTVLERALRKAGIPVAFSQGFHPLPLLSFGRALPVGVESRAEWFGITLRSPMRAEEVQARLAATLLRGLRVTGVDLLPLTGTIPGAVGEEFFLSLPSTSKDEVLRDWNQFVASEQWEIERQNKRQEVKIQDIRKLLANHTVEETGIRFTLDWENGYLSPLTFLHSIVPFLAPHELKLLKLRQVII